MIGKAREWDWIVWVLGAQNAISGRSTLSFRTKILSASSLLLNRGVCEHR